MLPFPAHLSEQTRPSPCSPPGPPGIGTGASSWRDTHARSDDCVLAWPEHPFWTFFCPDGARSCVTGDLPTFHWFLPLPAIKLKICSLSSEMNKPITFYYYRALSLNILLECPDYYCLFTRIYKKSYLFLIIC